MTTMERGLLTPKRVAKGGPLVSPTMAHSPSNDSYSGSWRKAMNSISALQLKTPFPSPPSGGRVPIPRAKDIGSTCVSSSQSSRGEDLQIQLPQKKHDFDTPPRVESKKRKLGQSNSYPTTPPPRAKLTFSSPPMAPKKKAKVKAFLMSQCSTPKTPQRTTTKYTDSLELRVSPGSVLWLSLDFGHR